MHRECSMHESHYRTLVTKFGRETHRLHDDNIKMELKEIWWQVWAGLFWLIIGTLVGYCEHSNELTGPINGGSFRYQLSDCHFLKKDSDPCSSVCISV